MGNPTFQIEQQRAESRDVDRKTIDKRSTSGNFVVFLRDIPSYVESNEQYSKAFTAMIANPEREEDEDEKGIILIVE